MAKTFSLLSLFCLLSLSLSSSSAEELSHRTTAHEELTIYGFPLGLLPKDVRGYSLNRTSGDFAVHLGDQCQITLPPDNYVATYSKIVRGKIVENKIAELDGIRVWAFFKWWSLTGIRSSGDDLVFEVGMVTAKYPSNNFDEAPACEGRRSDS